MNPTGRISTDSYHAIVECSRNLFETNAFWFRDYFLYLNTGQFLFISDHTSEGEGPLTDQKCSSQIIPGNIYRYS